MDIIEGYDLKNPVLGSFVFTFPKELTDALFERGSKGEDLAWETFKDFKDDLDQFIFRKSAKLNKRRHKRPYATSGTLGHRVNLHLWKSSSPLHPHYHFHDSILNYALSDDPTLEPIPFYFSKSDLKEIRRRWTACLLLLAESLDVDCPTLTLDDSAVGSLIEIDGEERTVNYADVNYSYQKIILANKGKVYHSLFYQNRDYLIDFCNYSNEDPDCDIPAGHLLNYRNRGRTFGLFRKLKLLETNSPTFKKEKTDTHRDEVCPLCGGKMERLGSIHWLEQLPKSLYVCDYDHRAKQRLKRKIDLDEISDLCSPLMSMTKGDP
jgi:hypothetical protein